MIYIIKYSIFYNLLQIEYKDIYLKYIHILISDKISFNINKLYNYNLTFQIHSYEYI